jgi:hypothetical protein
LFTFEKARANTKIQTLSCIDKIQNAVARRASQALVSGSIATGTRSEEMLDYLEAAAHKHFAMEEGCARLGADITDELEMRSFESRLIGS